MELPIAGVSRRAIWHLNLQETFADNGDICLHPGGQRRTLGKQLLRAHNLDAGTNLQTIRALVFGIHLRASLELLLIEQVVEDRTIALESHRVDVGQVVGNRRHLGILCRQTRLTDKKGSLHYILTSLLIRLGELNGSRLGSALPPFSSS
ncbi:hypothetical protein D3C84_630810 [compost metagenome]